MPASTDVVHYLLHPRELHAIVYWKTCRQPVHPRDEAKESRNVKECYRLLGLTSRSFVAVIQELHPELLMPVVVFYLILRSLDTVEDDMTLPLARKEPLLRNFYIHVDDEDWSFTDSGPNEKDREVLCKFYTVSREFNKLKKDYQVIIKDIAKKMGNGMADYAKRAADSPDGISVETIQDYQLYCHYVAGLVGEGLTRLFVEAGFVDPALLTHKPELMESMGQLLQQINITRDIREDYDDKRCFWPKEVWSKYVNVLDDLFLPQNRDKALQCSSEMVCMALNRIEDCLSYMAGITEQSTFNFVAIPQAMAIATLELCFQNPALFDRNIKISRGAACCVMIDSTQNFQRLCRVFRQYARKIHSKNNPSDPHFKDINTACDKIERFVVTKFPEEASSSAEESRTSTWLMYLGFAVVSVLVATKV